MAGDDLLCAHAQVILSIHMKQMQMGHKRRSAGGLSEGKVEQRSKVGQRVLAMQRKTGTGCGGYWNRARSSQRFRVE